MIKDALLFLWIFIFPILAWMKQIFYSQKKKQKGSSYSKWELNFFLSMEVLLYGFGLPFMISFGGDFLEALNVFCMIQIIALDMWFLTAIGPNFCNKIYSHIELDHLKGFKLFIFVILGGILFLFSCVTIPVLLAFFRLVSLWDIFIEQKVSTSLIVFILVFNPIYMYYQLKERLLKND